MSITLARVVNEQTLPQGLSRDGSILLDKIDKSQGNSENPPYAQVPKQKLYVPYANPANPAVKGYVDLVQTDEVILALDPDGSIGGLAATVPPAVSITLVNSALVAAPVVTSAASATPGAGDITIGGTTFLSVLPDVTAVYLTDAGGVTQVIDQADFNTHTATSIVILAAKITGVPAAGWTARVFANSKLSNLFTVT